MNTICSLPTRRSSDLRLHARVHGSGELPDQRAIGAVPEGRVQVDDVDPPRPGRNESGGDPQGIAAVLRLTVRLSLLQPRSEEHTSELQSTFKLVSSLL